jgi:putative acyl-CoA dehydrogenase
LEETLASSADTHEIVNQSPPLTGLNLFASDPGLSALVEGLPMEVIDELTQFGQQWGTAETFELGRIANAFPPILRTHDATGVRIDAVEFHPAWHALMRRSVAAGLSCSVWDASGKEANVRAVARAARVYMATQVEAGHINPMSMTNAAVAALAHDASITDRWLPLIRSRKYDSSVRPVTDKAGVTIGMGLTEKQGGSDLGANNTQGIEAGDRMAADRTQMVLSAPSSDASWCSPTRSTACHASSPRLLPDGHKNGMRLMRLRTLATARTPAPRSSSTRRWRG